MPLGLAKDLKCWIGGESCTMSGVMRAPSICGRIVDPRQVPILAGKIKLLTLVFYVRRIHREALETPSYAEIGLTPVSL